MAGNPVPPSRQSSNPNTDPADTPTNSPTADWRKVESDDPVAFHSKMQQFIELRAQGLSLRKISAQIGVPKSTLYDWNIRNSAMLACMRRVELEALEETLIGSRHQQITALTNTLKRLDKAFARKFRDYEYDLSATEIFWMAANLRQHLSRLYLQPALTDSPDPYRQQDLVLPSGQNRTET
jgi:hypothetical protein